MNERCVQLIFGLMNNNYPVKISELAEKYNVSNRTIRYDLDYIDQYLEKNNISKLKRKSNFGIKLIVNFDEKDKLMQSLKTINIYNYVLSKDERKKLILIELIQQSGYITINQLADKIMVSRGTLIKDLDNVKKWLQKFGVELQSLSKHGVKIYGDEKNLRQATMELLKENIDINKILDFSGFPINKDINVYMQYKFEKFFEGIDIKFIKNSLKIVEHELQTIFSDDAFISLVILIVVSIKRINLNKAVEVSNSNLHYLGTTKEFTVASNLARMLEERFHISMSISEIGYLALNLLGSSITATELTEKERWVDFEILTSSIIDNVGKIVNIGFDNDNQLFSGLLEHLRPAVYRIKNKLKVKNPLLKEIQASFSDLFIAVKANIKPVEEYAGGTFDDEEIAYFTMYFAASLERINSYHKKKKNILIVCGAGIGTAQLISAKIQSLFDVNIIDIVPYHQISSILKEKQVDLIVSTFQVKVDGVMSIEVQPILTDKDISLLNKYLVRINETNEAQSDEIIKVIKKYCTINDIDSLTIDLLNLLNTKHYNFTKGVLQPMLKDLLTEKTIKLGVIATDWEDCIRKGGEILKENGCIDDEYIDAMIDSVKEIGPYIVIAPGIAMPHARPEAGVKKIGMSLMTLKNPINFGNKDNDPAKIVICICSIDHSSHLKALAELVAVLDNEENVSKIKEAQDVNDILYLFKN